MNKKFSTLMAGFLLTSAFASAATPFHLSNKLKKVDEVKPGSSYFIVLDNDNNQKIDDKDQILSVVKNGSALDYKAYYVDIVFGKPGAGSYSVGGAPEKEANLLWKLGMDKQTVPSTAYYYSLYNAEVESYLSFDVSHNLLLSASDEILNDAAKGYSYFMTELSSATTEVGNGSRFYLYNPNTTSHQLQGNNTADVVLSGSNTQSLLFCVYDEVSADIEKMNKTIGGEGFVLNYKDFDKVESNVLYEQKVKAFDVIANTIEIRLSDGTVHTVPAGTYLVTSYPESLVGKEEISTAEEFLACSFIAVKPTGNKSIHDVDQNSGYGFEFAIVAAEDMNYVEDITKDQADITGQTYVGNACFNIFIPDFLTDDEAYNLRLPEIRIKNTKNELVAKQNVYMGVVKSEGKSHLVTYSAGQTFSTDKSTILNPKSLLSTEDMPSIYTIQFVSGENKEESSEYGQYLTVGKNHEFFSTTEENVAGDPLYQFVISDIDTIDYTTTFTNRQTGKKLVASLYTEDAENKIYTIYVDGDTYNQANVNEDNNMIVFEAGEYFSAKQIQLVPVTVENKFATFDTVDAIKGLVRFELARTSEADAKFYVVAPRTENSDDEIVIEFGGGKVMQVSEDAADQFELIKVLNSSKKDDTQYITHPYVINKDGKKYTSLKNDTVAYNLYNIKLFAPEEAKSYYVDGTSLVDNLSSTGNNKFAVKKNLDGSISLIYTKDIEDQNANYLKFAEAKKEKEAAWAVGSYYDLATTFNLAKTFMVAEPEAISLEAKPQHISVEAVRGGFLSMNADKDGILAMNSADAEAMTLWVDTVRSDEAVPSFYIAKGGNFLYNATDSLNSSLVGKDKYELEDGQAKLIFKAAELVSSDTLKTVVDGKEALVAAKANAGKKVKGGLGNFQYQIIKDEEGSDEYVIRLTDKYQYVRVINNMLTLDADKKKAARFLIESQATPTANEDVAVSEVKVLAGNGNVTIAGAAGKKVVVSNILGQVVANTVVSSDNATIAAPAGVVVVAVEGEAAVKAIVK